MNFDTFYQTHFDRIFNYLFRRTLNYNDSLDLLQDTFIKAHKHFAKIEAMEGKAGVAYLYRIASSTLMDYFRQQKKAPVELLEETAPMTPDYELKAEGHRLIAALKTLPDHYREAIQLYFVEGLPYAEISQILDKNESTLRSLVSRGLGILRESLGVEVGNPA